MVECEVKKRTTVKLYGPRPELTAYINMINLNEQSNNIQFSLQVMTLNSGPFCFDKK